jgi:hypothetical protein
MVRIRLPPAGSRVAPAGAARESDGRVSARLIAIANALEGMDRASAARLAGMVDAEIARLLYHRVGTRLTELRDQCVSASGRDPTHKSAQDADSACLFDLRAGSRTAPIWTPSSDDSRVKSNR